MSPNEDFLKKHLCPICHSGILWPHPEDKFSNFGWIKCNICAFMTQLPITFNNLNRIIYGQDDDE